MANVSMVLSLKISCKIYAEKRTSSMRNLRKHECLNRLCLCLFFVATHTVSHTQAQPRNHSHSNVTHTAKRDTIPVSRNCRKTFTVAESNTCGFNLHLDSRSHSHSLFRDSRQNALLLSQIVCDGFQYLTDLVRT